MLNKIPGTIGCYASVEGKVFRSLANGNLKEVKPYYAKSGYGSVVLKTTYGRKSFYIHRCICSAFKKQDKPEVNHIDGDKQNNHISNLEWVTTKENAVHAVANNLRPICFKNVQAKLNKEQVDYIRSVKIPTHKLAKEFGVSHVAVWNARNYKTYKETNV
tara:strand:- start:450 stop:929 length:480 start_codon:yes stop_codon:yes gene_type:complete